MSEFLEQSLMVHSRNSTEQSRQKNSGIYFWNKWAIFLENRARICKRLWSPEIDSDGPIPPAYVAWRAGTTNSVVVQARHTGNRFLGSLKGLQIRAQTETYPGF
jgi:hypothetical protein